MYFCPLVPTPNLKELGKCRMSLVLSHLVEDGDNYYTRFYSDLSKKGTHTILDNGAYEAWLENKPLASLDETLKRAELVGAHEIQFLESFCDGKRTVELAISWIETMAKKELKRFSWHAIIQGKDHHSFMECFEKLVALPEVSVIGVPKVVTPHCYSEICGTKDLASTRITALTELANKTTKSLHLLGLEDPKEILKQREFRYQNLRSVDSSFPVIHAIHGISYSLERDEYPIDLPRFDFSGRLDRETEKIALNNIQIIKEWCGDV